MSTNDKLPDPKDAVKIARRYFGSPGGSKGVHTFLKAAIATPIIFLLYIYVKYGFIYDYSLIKLMKDELIIGFTIGFAVFFLIGAFASFFAERPEYHTTVKLKGDIIDKIGAFWFIACFFGPLIGWLVTAVVPLKPGNWWMVLGLRVFFSAILPIITALPLLRYLKGKTALVGFPLLIGLTSLSALSSYNAIADLKEGPEIHYEGDIRVYKLNHMERVFEEMWYDQPVKSDEAEMR